MRLVDALLQTPNSGSWPPSQSHGAHSLREGATIREHRRAISH